MASSETSTNGQQQQQPIPVKSARQVAESEDIYFGGNRQQQQQQQQQQQEESLLGQALQYPTVSGSSSQLSDGAVVVDANSNDEEGEDLSHSTNFYERETPTFVTRKRPIINGGSSNGGNSVGSSSGASSAQTPMHQNHQQQQQQQRQAMTTTNNIRINNNRSSSKQDPLCMSHRSLQSEDSQANSNNHHSNNMVIPQSVDTVPTSNVATLQAYQRQHQQQKKLGNNNVRPLHNSPHKRAQQEQTSVSPPSQLRFHHPSAAAKNNANNANANNNGHGAASATNANNANSNNNNGGKKRSVFGNRVQQRYPSAADQRSRANNHNPGPPPADPAPFYNIIENGSGQMTFEQAAPQPPDWEWADRIAKNKRNNNKSNKTAAPAPPLSMIVTSSGDDMLCSTVTLDDFTPTPTALSVKGVAASAISPLQSPPLHHPLLSSSKDTAAVNNTNSTRTTTTTTNSSGTINTILPRDRSYNNHKRGRSSQYKKHKRAQKMHETVHAQSLLLGLCFMAIWSPNNIMAPNLTQIASFYGMSESERDLYLGSFLALATGVLSFPLSAAIGILTDLYPRKILFVGTAFGGALASAATGLSPTYPHLLLARFFSGGFMSASVSVAFSLLGDLFAAEERNAASSGLTAMMGLGIILGQVYAGIVGNTRGWQSGFFVSSILTAVLGLCVAIWVQEPVRGGKEKVLQAMIKQGKRYDRTLTWDGFLNAMQNNRSNIILMAQGFFSSLPFGVLFVFFNDYLSQERGFSVPDATFIVLVFGFGCAVGGILGGYLGAKIQAIQRSLLPVFMAVTTMVGILPFFGLLNGHTTNAHGYRPIFYAFMGGCFSSMPSVNVRPCLINVNPPEVRGISLTVSNLVINLARGVGPSCITLLGSSFQLSRQISFNITLGVFWTLSAIQLCLLAQTLPHDQDKMETELARYAASALETTTAPGGNVLDGTEQSLLMAADEFSLEPDVPDSNKSLADDVSLVSIEDRMTTFDGMAVRESISFIQKGMQELNFRPMCAGGPQGGFGSYDDDYDSDIDDIEDFDDDELQLREEARRMLLSRDYGDDTMSPVDLMKRRNMWIQQQQQLYGATDSTVGGASEADQNTSGTEDVPSSEKSRLII